MENKTYAVIEDECVEIYPEREITLGSGKKITVYTTSRDSNFKTNIDKLDIFGGDSNGSDV